MSIGEKIKEHRKKKNLSQEQFAEIFNITRQTVSNWENEKSYPDLEVIIKISEFFEISTDELLKDDPVVVKKIDNEKNKNKKLLIGMISFISLTLVASLCLFFYIKKINSISFEISQNKTINTTTTNKQSIDIDQGFFNLPKKGKTTIKANGDIDSGELFISIINLSDKQKVYQITGDTLKDEQTILLPEGSYEIQIKANNYKENIVSLDYQVKIDNQ